jgi:DNA polymerase I-like protein with 3'-5' exonuclease and polymerase domains
MFIPHDPANELSATDWVQQELYIQSFLADDDKLMEAVLSTEGVHNYHARLFGLDKTRAKNFIYGTIFWGSAKAIQHQCRQRGFNVRLEEIVPIQEEVIQRYRKTRTWQKRYLDKVIDNKFAVNPMGRRRYFYNPKDHVNKIINFPIQSIGAEMLWRILPELRAVFRRYGAKLLAPIHDEALYEHHPSVRRVLNAQVKAIMEQRFEEVASGFYVPTSCKTGLNWYHMKEQPLKVAA